MILFIIVGLLGNILTGGLVTMGGKRGKKL